MTHSERARPSGNGQPTDPDRATPPQGPSPPRQRKPSLPRQTEFVACEQAIYWWFRRFVRRLLFRTIHDVALMLVREAARREASPTGGVLDSQTVKAPFAEVRGYDGAKRIVGRKRHIAVDTDGRLLLVNLTPADVSDSAGAQMILAAIRKRWPWLKHLFAYAGYDRTKLMDKAAFLDFVVEIVRRSDEATGFEVIPRRWVVEMLLSTPDPVGPENNAAIAT